MLAAQLVVAIGRDHQRTHALDTPSEQPQYVQGRFVGPVDVLDYHDRRPPPLELVAQRL